MGFSVLRLGPFFRLDSRFFVPKNFGFSVVVSVRFRSRFSVFGKNKIGFSDSVFDAVRVFPVSLRKIGTLSNENGDGDGDRRLSGKIQIIICA